MGAPLLDLLSLHLRLQLEMARVVGSLRGAPVKYIRSTTFSPLNAAFSSVTETSLDSKTSSYWQWRSSRRIIGVTVLQRGSRNCSGSAGSLHYDDARLLSMYRKPTFRTQAVETAIVKVCRLQGDVAELRPVRTAN